MSEAIGMGIIAFVVSFILGWFIALATENIKYWLDQRAEAKTWTILPDGKGGYVTLPPGVKYISIQNRDKN